MDEENDEAVAALTALAVSASAKDSGDYAQDNDGWADEGRDQFASHEESAEFARRSSRGQDDSAANDVDEVEEADAGLPDGAGQTIKWRCIDPTHTELCQRCAFTFSFLQFFAPHCACWRHTLLLCASAPPYGAVGIVRVTLPLISQTRALVRSGRFHCSALTRTGCWASTVPYA